MSKCEYQSRCSKFSIKHPVCTGRPITRIKCERYSDESLVDYLRSKREDYVIDGKVYRREDYGR